MAQHHVAEIVEKDARIIETLIQAAQEVIKGARQVATLTTDTGNRFAFAGKLSDEWTLFDNSVFFVRISTLLRLKGSSRIGLSHNQY